MKKGKVHSFQEKSNIEEQDICFCNYVLMDWDCAPPDVVLYSLLSTQAVQLGSFCDCTRISQVFRSSHSVFTHLRWDGTQGWGEIHGEGDSVQREKKDFQGDLVSPELHLHTAVQGPA